MKALLQSRRAMIGILGILACTAISWKHGMDTSMAIAGIVASIAASNGWERSKTGENK